MFSLRIDPALDGFKNTVYYEDSVPMPEDDNNPYMVGYTTEQNVMKSSGSAFTSVDRHRVFKIRNDSIINPITHHPIAYKLQTSPSQMLLAGPNSFGSKRARFATRPIWVTKYQDDELFAAGEFTNQSKQSDGVEVWAGRNDAVENEDVVLWHSMFLPLDFQTAANYSQHLVLRTTLVLKISPLCPWRRSALCSSRMDSSLRILLWMSRLPASHSISPLCTLSLLRLVVRHHRSEVRSSYRYDL